MRNLIFIIAIALLLAFAVFSLCFKGWRQKRVKRLCVLGGVAGVLALGYFWCFPAWSYPEVTGAYAVARADEVYIDESRVESYEDDGSARWLNVSFWYPQDDTAGEKVCPLIVFSHGSFGTRESNVVQYRELASHGYVVCAIEHTYQSLGTTGPDGERAGLDSGFQQQVLRASDDTPEQRAELAALFDSWMTVRTADIGFVLDTVVSRTQGGEGGVYRLVDTSRIGLMGHSMGGAAALALGRERSDVSAVIALEAPFMGDVEGVTAEGDFVWDDTPYPVPLLSVYTDASWNILDTAPQYAQNNAVRHDDCAGTQDIYMQGAGHMTLTDLVYELPPLCLLFGQRLILDADGYEADINAAYVEFLNAYLKQQ